MKTEQELNDALTLIQLDDQACPCTAHVQGRQCFDVGHAIRGTWRSTLQWALDLGDAPWPQISSHPGGE